MSDYDDRGAYTPPADRLAFDPRQPVRGGGPAPVTLIVSGLVLVGLVGGVFYLYRDGFRHKSEAPALVGAPVADVRTAAAAPDASAAPAGLTVDKTAAPAPPAPAFGPPPGQAMPAQPSTAQVQPAAAQPLPPVVAQAAPPVTAKPAPPRVVMLAPEAAPKPDVATTAAPPAHVAAAPATRLAAAEPPAEHAAVPRAVVHHAAPVTISALTDDALTHRARLARSTRDDEATRPRLAEASAPALSPTHHAVVAHIKGAQIAAAPAVRAAPPAMRAATGTGTGWVQIGAFSSPTLADQGWRDIARLQPAGMSGKGKAVQPLDRDDGTTLYRTYVTGFASVSAAQAFCDELRAAGKSCMVR
jgi:hypothetical protein